MDVHRWGSFAVISLLLLHACGPSPEGTGAALDEQATIRTLWEDAGDALCQGDWEGYRGLWASGAEVELLHPDAPERIVGSAAILETYRELIDSGFECVYETDWFEVRFSESRDVAWVSTGGVLSGVDPDTWAQTTWYTLVFTKENGDWGLSHAHASSLGGSE
jgi:hypothetical protein